MLRTAVYSNAVFGLPGEVQHSWCDVVDPAWHGTMDVQPWYRLHQLQDNGKASMRQQQLQCRVAGCSMKQAVDGRHA